MRHGGAVIHADLPRPRAKMCALQGLFVSGSTSGSPSLDALAPPGIYPVAPSSARLGPKVTKPASGSLVRDPRSRDLVRHLPLTRAMIRTRTTRCRKPAANQADHGTSMAITAVPSGLILPSVRKLFPSSWPPNYGPPCGTCGPRCASNEGRRALAWGTPRRPRRLGRNRRTDSLRAVGGPRLGRMDRSSAPPPDREPWEGASSRRTNGWKRASHTGSPHTGGNSQPLPGECGAEDTS
jgi:hypothetical protein